MSSIWYAHKIFRKSNTYAYASGVNFSFFENLGKYHTNVFKTGITFSCNFIGYPFGRKQLHCWSQYFDHLGPSFSHTVFLSEEKAGLNMELYTKDPITISIMVGVYLRIWKNTG